MNKLIVTDVDGCLLNWEIGFNKWMVETTNHRRDETYAHEYDLSKAWGMSGQQISAYIDEFNMSDAIASFPPFGDAVEYVRKLHDDHGYKFAVVTSMGGDTNSRVNRIKNLNNVFGDFFESFNFLPLNTSKSPILTKWKDSGLWWVEDKLQNALDGHALGLKSILFNAQHNAHHKGNELIRVDSWADVYRLITEDELITTE